MKPSVESMLKNSKLSLEELIDYIRTQYNNGTKLHKLAEYLGVSVSSVQRFCKEYNIKIKTKEEQLNDLHNTTRGRKWTDEKAKSNVSIGVKNSYDEQLRNKRSESNKRRWQSWSKDKRKQVVMNGLVVMHKNYRGGDQR